MVIQLAVAIALGAMTLSEVEQLGLHHRALFGAAALDSTVRRALAALDQTALVHVAKARRRVRRHVWSLPRLRPGGSLAERRREAAARLQTESAAQPAPAIHTRPSSTVVTLRDCSPRSVPEPFRGGIC